MLAHAAFGPARGHGFHAGEKAYAFGAVLVDVAEAVADVIVGKLDVKRAAERLLARPVGKE